MSKITQFSTIGALMSGHFQGDFTLGKIDNKRLFGIGCSCGISGELTICEGEFWEATADEKLHRLKDNHIPFVQLTEFEADSSFHAAHVSDDNLASQFNQYLPINNIFLAVNVTAVFDQIKIRRPQRDESLSRSVTEMSEAQQEDTLTAISGQLIGFWTPELFGRISVPGFHFHFINDEKTISGHVLSFKADAALVDYQIKESIEIKNPNSEAYRNLNINITALDELIGSVEK